MALMECRECRGEVSSMAKACPHCGAPVSSSVQVIEKTSKHWKSMRLVSVAMFFAGVAACLSFQNTSGIIMIGSFLIAGSMFLWLGTSIAIW